MSFKTTVRKGAVLTSIFLILFSMNVAAWNPDTMKAEMDEKFESKFGPSFAAADSGNDDSVEQRQGDSDTTRQVVRRSVSTSSGSSVFGDRDWDAWKQQFNQDDQDDTQTEQRTSDRTDRTTDDNDDQQVSDSNPDNSDTQDSQTVNPSGSMEDRAEQYLHNYINEERRQRGLSPLQLDSALSGTAQEKSQDMASRNYFSHNDPEGDNFRDLYNQNGVNCRLGGENIARTWFDRSIRTDSGSTVHYDNAQELADGLRRQWMTSSAHRDAILRSRYNEHGLGVEITSSGRVYATEHFCT